MSISVAQSVLLGVVEGLTEFLPVSSTAHLTVTEKALGLRIDDPAVTAFTAVIQVGAIAAVVLYFRRDIARLVAAFGRGLTSAEARRSPDWRFVWYVVAGSVPIGVAGLAGKSLVEGPLRSLWVIGVALVVWSAVMVAAERTATQRRHEADVGLRDAVFVGVLQVAALVPGVSRSGATISAGLFRGLDRVAATRLSFFLSIPALVAAGALELKDALGQGAGAAPVVVGTLVSFVVGYASVAFLLRLVARRSIEVFVGYRVVAGAAVLLLVATGVLSAT